MRILDMVTIPMILLLIILTFTMKSFQIILPLRMEVYLKKILKTIVHSKEIYIFFNKICKIHLNIFQVFMSIVAHLNLRLVNQQMKTRTLKQFVLKVKRPPKNVNTKINRQIMNLSRKSPKMLQP